MPTVRCPSCQRALHLPEGEQGTMACCPLCKTTFPTPPAEPLFTVPAPIAAPFVPRPVPQPPAPPPAAPENPLRFDDRDGPAAEAVPHADRTALRAAADWQRTYAGLASLHVLTCGCFNMLALLELTHVGIGLHVLVAVLFPVVALFLIFSGAEAMAKRRNRPLALIGSFLAVAVAASQVLLPLAVITVAQAERGGNFADPSFYCVSLLLALALGIVGVIGGVKGLYLLHKPAVIQAFQSDR
jgi:hypothetical protein